MNDKFKELIAQAKTTEDQSGSLMLVDDEIIKFAELFLAETCKLILEPQGIFLRPDLIMEQYK